MAVNPGSLGSHQKWSAEFGFDFPICVDDDKKVAIAYGVVKPEGGIQRCVIVVNRRGKVTWVKEGMPETAEILNAIDDMARNDPDSTRLSSS